MKLDYGKYNSHVIANNDWGLPILFYITSLRNEVLPWLA